MDILVRKIALLVGVYINAGKRRTDELLESFRRNLANDTIDEVHAFIEDEDLPKKLSVLFNELIRHPKVAVVRRLWETRHRIT